MVGSMYTAKAGALTSDPDASSSWRKRIFKREQMDKDVVRRCPNYTPRYAQRDALMSVPVELKDRKKRRDTKDSVAPDASVRSRHMSSGDTSYTPNDVHHDVLMPMPLKLELRNIRPDPADPAVPRPTTLQRKMSSGNVSHAVYAELHKRRISSVSSKLGSYTTKQELVAAINLNHPALRAQRPRAPAALPPVSPSPSGWLAGEGMKEEEVVRKRVSCDSILVPLTEGLEGFRFDLDDGDGEEDEVSSSLGEKRSSSSTQSSTQASRDSGSHWSTDERSRHASVATTATSVTSEISDCTVEWVAW